MKLHTVALSAALAQSSLAQEDGMYMHPAAAAAEMEYHMMMAEEQESMMRELKGKKKKGYSTAASSPPMFVPVAAAAAPAAAGRPVDDNPYMYAYPAVAPRSTSVDHSTVTYSYPTNVPITSYPAESRVMHAAMPAVHAAMPAGIYSSNSPVISPHYISTLPLRGPRELVSSYDSSLHANPHHGAYFGPGVHVDPYDVDPHTVEGFYAPALVGTTISSHPGVAQHTLATAPLRPLETITAPAPGPVYSEPVVELAGAGPRLLKGKKGAGYTNVDQYYTPHKAYVRRANPAPSNNLVIDGPHVYNRDQFYGEVYRTDALPSYVPSLPYRAMTVARFPADSYPEEIVNPFPSYSLAGPGPLPTFFQPAPPFVSAY